MTKRVTAITEVKRMLGLSPRAPMTRVFHSLSHHYGLANVPLRYRKTYWFRKRVENLRYIALLDAGDDE